MVELLKTPITNSVSYYDIYAHNGNCSNTVGFIDYWSKLSRLIPNEVRSDIQFYNNYFKDRISLITNLIASRMASYLPAYKPQDLERDVEFYPNVLANNIPLSEDFSGYGGVEFDGTPGSVTLRTIVNAGWETVLRNTPEWRAAFSFHRSEAEGFNKFNNLLLKSIDLSEVKTRWEEAKVRVTGR